RIRMIEEELWPIVRIQNGSLRRIDAEVSIQRGEHLLVVDRAIEWSFTVAGRTTDDLAHVQTAAKQERGRRRRIVIAPGIIVDARRAAKLAPNEHEYIFEH